MLTISLDRVVDLLDKADEVELPEPAASAEDAEAAIEETDAIEELLADDEAYRLLTQAVAALTPVEAQELMALALLEQNSADQEEWPAMLEQARDIPAEEVSSELVRTLVLTDDILLALERLGYVVEEDDLSEEDEDSDEEPEAE